MFHLLAIPLTGTSVNPARSIGVGVFAGTDAIVQLWLFVLAPFLGAAIAGLTYPVLFGHGAAPVAGSGLQLRRWPPGAVPGYGAPDQYQQQWNQQYPPQQPWPPQPPQQWQQPQYPTGQPAPQAWPSAPTASPAAAARPARPARSARRAAAGRAAATAVAGQRRRGRPRTQVRPPS